MEKQGITKSEEIYQRIHKIERMLCEQLETTRENFSITGSKTQIKKNKHQENACCYYSMPRTRFSDDCKTLKKQKNEKRQ